MITEPELGELMQVVIRAEAEDNQVAADELRQKLSSMDVITIIRTLHVMLIGVNDTKKDNDDRDDEKNVSKKKPTIYDIHALLETLLRLSDVSMDAIDFVWPQIMHMYATMSTDNVEKILELELLEEFMVRMCVKSVHLGLQLVYLLS